MNATIQEKYTLPSKGLLYEEKFNPTVTLRSMTTEEEMLRLNQDDTHETMAKIIDACIVEDLPISSYDMCIGDYQFLLHKLRIVSHGKDYHMVIQCPNCEQIVKSSVNLDLEEVHEYDPEVGLDTQITLPIKKDVLELSLQTPRMIDMNSQKAKEKRRKEKTAAKYELMYTCMSLISTINGKKVNDVMLEDYVRKLHVKDVNYILAKGDELNGKVGIDTLVVAKCPECKYEVVTPFREQPEFFGPEVH